LSTKVLEVRLYYALKYLFLKWITHKNEKKNPNREMKHKQKKKKRIICMWCEIGKIKGILISLCPLPYLPQLVCLHR